MDHRTELEIRALVAAFEQHTLLYIEWTHSAHLTVAAVYVDKFGEKALAHIRAGIQSLNAHFGVEQTPTGGYHETLTIVWTRLIRHHLDGLPSRMAWEERIGSVVDGFQDKGVSLRHYTRERIMSTDARYGWVEPDLAPLP